MLVRSFLNLNDIRSSISWSFLKDRYIFIQDSFDAIVDRFISNDDKPDISLGHDSFNKFIDELGSPFTSLSEQRRSAKKRRRSLLFDPQCSSTPAVNKCQNKMSDQTPKRPKVRRAIMSDLTDGQSGMGYHSSDSNSPRNRSPLNQVKIQPRKSYSKLPARFWPKLQNFYLKLTQSLGPRLSSDKISK